MAHKVIKEITQPVHGPGGSVLYSPGETFPEDREFGPEVPWRWVVAEVPDEPEPVSAPEPKAAVKASHAGKGT